MELIEQPLKKKAYRDLLNLTEEERDICAADEDLVSDIDGWQMTKVGRTYGIYNIKLMKCGGISGALRISTIAEYEGIDLMWGCNDESRISITAALCTALSCRRTKYLDLDGSFDLAKDIVSGGFTLENGIMTPRDKPGLGVKEL